MAFYNRMKAADRERELKDRQDEVAAVDAGTWPRDENDLFRWGPNRNFPDMAAHAAFAREMCMVDITYLKGVPARIAAGDLPGWEA